ncbi:hypothetical protein ACIRPK_32965 [Kitasatospora sp. NPDC101801]|uniref:hypothetical protein n=1 Tax=Kitasatospora sp. NPDC101801 TaxID=3364103 RepID=UPI00381E1A7D
MSKGTSGSYWNAPALPSVFKHAPLSRYIPKFGGMTGSRSRGEGLNENGDSGSADKILRIAADHQGKGLVRWTCFFTEKSPASFSRLEALVAEYRSKGVDARAFNSDVLGLLDQVLATAAGRPSASRTTRYRRAKTRSGLRTALPSAGRTRRAWPVMVCPPEKTLPQQKPVGMAGEGAGRGDCSGRGGCDPGAVGRASSAAVLVKAFHGSEAVRPAPVTAGTW